METVPLSGESPDPPETGGLSLILLLLVKVKPTKGRWTVRAVILLGGIGSLCSKEERGREKEREREREERESAIITLIHVNVHTCACMYNVHVHLYCTLYMCMHVVLFLYTIL